MTDLELQIADEFEFFPDLHAYKVDGGARQVFSVSQVIKAAGLICYDGIPKAIMEFACWRGKLSHDFCALSDKGEDVLNEYDIPVEVGPRVSAWISFCRECGFIPFPDQVEVARVVKVGPIEYGMTPDVVGLLAGIPAVVERKNTASVHPSWGVQLAAYEAGLPRPKNFRNYKRVAVQLKADGKYKAIPYDSPDDWPVFQQAHGVAAWKLNNRLFKLAA